LSARESILIAAAQPLPLPFAPGLSLLVPKQFAGTLQLCGVFINAVTYVTIVIAIGLLVDYVMHVLLRYYETTGATREEKVLETLETMGASMLMGGVTTWLGVISLAMSSTKIFNTIVS